MAQKRTESDLIVIKKYANRRLYDTSTSSYVTLEHLSELVRLGKDFEVRDAKSGEDLTRQVLTQIIFEHENKGNGALPLNFLRKLISFYGGGGTASMLPAWLDASMNCFEEAQQEWARTGNPMRLMEVQTKKNMELFQKTMAMMMAPMTAGASTKAASPAQDMMNGAMEMQMQTMTAMQEQMAAMQDQLEKLSKKR